MGRQLLCSTFIPSIWINSFLLADSFRLLSFSAMCCAFLHTPILSSTEIYRIVSNKALQSSDDVIKPSGGETITVQPSADDGGQTKKNGCC